MWPPYQSSAGGPDGDPQVGGKNWPIELPIEHGRAFFKGWAAGFWLGRSQYVRAPGRYRAQLKDTGGFEVLAYHRNWEQGMSAQLWKPPAFGT